MMTNSESAANFRSSYYDKAGIRNVNETKALDAAINRNPVDLGKLCCLLQRISVPSSHRERIWKLILGVTAADSGIAKKIEEDRRGQFEALKRSLEVMRLVDANTSPAELVTLMILLERGELKMCPAEQLASGPVRDLRMVFSVLCRVSSKLQDAYWLARNFHNHMIALKIDANELINQTRILLEKDDPSLLDHILSNTESSTLPIHKWFNLLFASVLPENALLKVWDKILGGLVGKHLANTAKTILIHLRPVLMQSCDNIANILQQPISDENAVPLIAIL